jgi:thiol-disulfide isomerase/thioredoxin
MKLLIACMLVASGYGLVIADEAGEKRENRASGKSTAEETVKPKEHPFRVRVIDSNGAAVPEAQVGQGAGRLADPGAEWEFAGILSPGKWRAAITGDDGVTEMFVDDIAKPKVALVARHAARKLVGFHVVSRDELLSASKGRSSVTISLVPECRVHGRLQSSALELLGRSLRITFTDVSVDGNWLFTDYSHKCELEFFLPPGSYELDARGNDTSEAYRSFKVEAGKDLELDAIELQPTNMVKLIGHPAPELRDVVAWKNTKPLKLADLRGKYVLLDFWGWWCDGCVHQMKELFAMHDRLGKRGLVIIGVHVGIDDESIDTVEKLDAKIAETREHIWDGRDVPYPVAMVGSQRNNYPGSEQKGRSLAAVDYGVITYPSAVLIDPAGNVVGWFDEEEHVKLFEKLPGN